MATLSRAEIVNEARVVLGRWKFDDMRRGERIRMNLEHIVSGADIIGGDDKPARHWCSDVTDFLADHCFTQCERCLTTDTHPLHCVRCHAAGLPSPNEAPLAEARWP